MKLEKINNFYHKYGKRKIIIMVAIMLIFLLFIWVMIYQSYGLYEDKKTFNVLTGKVPNFKKIDCSVMSVWEYDVVGKDKFVAPCEGVYQIEAWGASGGHNSKGAYTSGIIGLEKNTTFYIFVGGEGVQQNTTAVGGFNGGGSSQKNGTSSGATGGGATDIRLVDGAWDDEESLNSRIMVAAGGGGFLGPAGGLKGYNGIVETSSQLVYQGKAGTQISGGSSPSTHSCSTSKGGAGGFGSGGTGGKNSRNESGGGSGGGSGYYGGSGASGLCNGTWAGGGGSSFISGHAGCIAITSKNDRTPRNDETGTKCSENTTNVECSKHYSNYIFNDTKMIDGLGYEWTTEVGNEVVRMPTHDGTDTMIGNNGSGFVKITYRVNSNKVWEFDEVGKEEFVTPQKGKYKIELWGASGGNNSNSGGAYTSGIIELEKNTTFYIFVGGEGVSYDTTAAGGFNGGGSSQKNGNASGSTGGGATDIRLVDGAWNDEESLNSRIMVAAGSGGFTNGAAGGLKGYNGKTTSQYDNYQGKYGTQLIGGGVPSTHSCSTSKGGAGGFGYGGIGGKNKESTGGGSGGGSGYYGGSGATGLCSGTWAGGGGSSFISGHAGCIAITSKNDRTPRNDETGTKCSENTTNVECSKHYSNYIFNDTKMIDGLGYEWTTEKIEPAEGMPTYDGTDTMKGNIGNGYAKITLLNN